MVWTDTGGGDHGGADWIISVTTTVAGTHTNIGTFRINSGITATQEALTEGESASLSTVKQFKVYADVIDIQGTFNGNSKGNTSHQGLSGNGLVTATVVYNQIYRHGGAGASHGGSGGPGDAAGSTYGEEFTNDIDYGSGGTSLSVSGYTTIARYGGYGGGAILLSAETITVSGAINVVGGNGSFGDQLDVTISSGAGSGGAITMFGNAITVSGTLNANGGNGASTSTQTRGGGGGGGRIKMFYTTLNTSGGTITANGGTADSSTYYGQPGTIAEVPIGYVSPTTTTGQVIILKSGMTSQLSSITMNVDTVTTTGDVTCTIYDSIAKTTSLAVVVMTVTTPGDYVFTLTSDIPMRSNILYYVEFSATVADISLGVAPTLNVLGGSMYVNALEVSSFELYAILNGTTHVNDVNISNTLSPAFISSVTGAMLTGAVHTLNSNGIGSIQYIDNFTTTKYLVDIESESNVTHDAGNDELDIGSGGYATYVIDTKYPVINIPVITAIFVGAPKIEISLDNFGTPLGWFEIDATVVSGSNVLALQSVGNVVFKNNVKLWIRISECSVSSLQFDIDTVVNDMSELEIFRDGANTFLCTQDQDMNYNVRLIWNDRRWA